jgi:hypothetical protein
LHQTKATEIHSFSFQAKGTMHHHEATPQAKSDSTPTSSSENSLGRSDGLGRRRFVALGLVGAIGSIFANAGDAIAATAKKKTVVKKGTKKTAAPKAVAKATTAVPTVVPIAASDSIANSSATFSEAQEVAITFTFVRTASGGRTHDPYVVVWIEDANEALVRNVSLFYQLQRGDKWLRDLRRWNNAYNRNVAALGADRLDEVTSATRIPGVYNLAWDGRDEAKNLVPHGTYYVCIEAAVEKGSYQLMREPIQLTGAPVTLSPADKGDLQRAKIELRARK